MRRDDPMKRMTLIAVLLLILALALGASGALSFLLLR